MSIGWDGCTYVRVFACLSRQCRDEADAKEKASEQKSTYVTCDDNDDSRSVAAAAAYDAIDVSRPVSQTSLLTHHAPDDVREIP